MAGIRDIVIDQLKVYLKDAPVEQLEIAADDAVAFFVDETTVDPDAFDLTIVSAKAKYDRIAKAIRKLAEYNYTMLGSAGIKSESYANVSESYTDGIPEEVKAAIKQYRKVKW